MKNGSYIMRTKIFFGSGCLADLPAQIKAIGADRILFLCDPALKKSEENLSDLLKEANIAFTVFNEIEPDPTHAGVAKGTALYNEFRAQAIIALGGGSVIDSAKGIAVVAKHGGKIEDYEERNLTEDVVPIFAIPTTAGTGSEVSRVAIIQNANHFKMVIRGDVVVPSFAFLDPDLLATLPVSVASATGMDSLTHAIEGYMALEGNVFTEAYAEKAMEMLGRSLKPFVANRADTDAATDMILGTCFGGITQSLARPTNAHMLSHALSGLFHIPHGTANAVLLPAVLRFNALADKGKYHRAYTLLTGRTIDRADFCTDDLIGYVERMNSDLGIPKTLGAFGIGEKDVDELVRDTMKSTLFKNNPRTTTEADVRNLYLEIL